MKIAHVLNPFKCDKNNPSYLYYAQPITFKSMRNAQLEAKKENIDIELYAANFPEDDEIIPDYFIKLPHLKKSTKKLFSNISGNKKLPIIQEILDLTFKHSKADYIIFTNSDIGVQKNFYTTINNLIKENNYTSLVINRRDIKKKENDTILTDKDEHMDIIYNMVKKGEKHPGKDCFIMKRDLVKKINLNNMFIGYPPWGYTLHKKLRQISKKDKIFLDLKLTFHLGSDRSWQRSNNKLERINTQISKVVLGYIKYNKIQQETQQRRIRRQKRNRNKTQQQTQQKRIRRQKKNRNKSQQETKKQQRRIRRQKRNRNK